MPFHAFSFIIVYRYTMTDKRGYIKMDNELTKGPVVKSMLLFAIPMILGDLLQQCYNIADTLIVGRYLGADALAAVGSAFSLMTFLTLSLIHI